MGSALIQGPDFHFNFLLSGVDVCGESLHSLALHRPRSIFTPFISLESRWPCLPALTPHLLSPWAKRSAGPQTPGHYTYLNPAHFNLVWTLHLGPISSSWINFTFTLPWRRRQGWMKKCQSAFLTPECIDGCMMIVFVVIIVIGCYHCRVLGGPWKGLEKTVNENEQLKNNSNVIKCKNKD